MGARTDELIERLESKFAEEYGSTARARSRVGRKTASPGRVDFWQEEARAGARARAC
jgi:hypothetical protein